MMGTSSSTVQRHLYLWISFLLFSGVSKTCRALSFSSSTLSTDIARARLSQALASPSGKLTISPELIIPEPVDPTAILLQSNALQGLSKKIRNAKANAVVFQGSLTALQTFCVEQESARGNFPGPVPVIYSCDENGDDRKLDLSRVAKAGAEGFLVSVMDGKHVTSADDIAKSLSSSSSSSGGNNNLWVEQCRQALSCGIQPVPEVTIPQEAVGGWDAEQTTRVASALTEIMGCEPVAIVLTVSAQERDNGDDTAAADSGDEIGLPLVPKAINKKIPILGSIRTPAGDGRLATEANRFKTAGYLGAFLRRECIPGFRVQLDLEIVSKFWAGCIADMKSTRSKSFSFRSKNNMEKSAATQWGNYQKSVIESGALGDPKESYSVVDEAAGE